MSGFFRVKANDLGYTADLERGVMVQFGGDVPGQVEGLAKVKGCVGPEVSAPVADVARPTFDDY
jgi:endonuclease III